MPALGRPKLSRKISHMNNNTDRLQRAKEIAEKAIKVSTKDDNWCRPLPHNPSFQKTLRKKPFENIVWKGKTAGNQYFDGWVQYYPECVYNVLPFGILDNL